MYAQIPFYEMNVTGACTLLNNFRIRWLNCVILNFTYFQNLYIFSSTRLLFFSVYFYMAGLHISVGENGRA